MCWNVEVTDECKTWLEVYDRMIPIADNLYDVYLDELRREGFAMTGHRPFSELKKNWSGERRASNQARKAELAAEYATLEELRVALGLSQEELAQRLDVQQPAVSKLVSRSDMRISTLRDLIEAMGGELHVIAKFRDRVVELANFK